MTARFYKNLPGMGFQDKSKLEHAIFSEEDIEKNSEKFQQFIQSVQDALNELLNKGYTRRIGSDSEDTHFTYTLRDVQQQLTLTAPPTPEAERRCAYLLS